MKLITSAALYRATLPPASAMEVHLEKLPHEELPPRIGKGSGFVPVPFTGQLVHSFPGGYAFSLRYDEKILPGSVIREKLREWVKAFEKVNGRPPGRKETAEARGFITGDLLAKALVKSKVITCFYETDSETLIVPTTSAKLRSEVLGHLVCAVESMKTTTIHVSNTKGSLTTRLISAAIHGDADAFPGFEVGQKAVLSGETGKVTFAVEGLLDREKGLGEAFATGMQVIELSLKAKGAAFRLTQDFMLKGIAFDDGELRAFESKEEEFEHEASVQTLCVSRVVSALCAMFGYTPPDEQDPSADLC